MSASFTATVLLAVALYYHDHASLDKNSSRGLPAETDSTQAYVKAHAALTQTEAQLATMLIDYSTAALFAALVWTLFTGFSYEGDLISCLQLFYVANLLFFLLIWKDNLQLSLFPASIVSSKKSLPSRTLDFPDQLDYFFQGVLVTSFILCTLLYTGVAVLPKPALAQLFSFYFATQAESFISGLLRDMLFTRTHTHMHSSYKSYAQWHKTHHLITSSVSIFQGMAMDLPDYLLEHFTGTALLALLSYGVFGVPLNAWSLLLDVWIHASVHSANPLACVYLNPLLDTLFKGSLAHGVHHVEPRLNLEFFPWHHLDEVDGYGRDVDIYNKVMGTSLE